MAFIANSITAKNEAGRISLGLLLSQLGLSAVSFTTGRFYSLTLTEDCGPESPDSAEPPDSDRDMAR
jgi:hypothetical protein